MSWEAALNRLLGFLAKGKKERLVQSGHRDAHAPPLEAYWRKRFHIPWVSVLDSSDSAAFAWSVPFTSTDASPLPCPLQLPWRMLLRPAVLWLLCGDERHPPTSSDFHAALCPVASSPLLLFSGWLHCPVKQGSFASLFATFGAESLLRSLFKMVFPFILLEPSPAFIWTTLASSNNAPSLTLQNKG